MGLQSPSSTEFLVSSAVFFLVSIVFFIARILSNIWVLKRIRWDDLLMIVIFMVYCALIAIVNVSARSATNLFPEEQLAGIMADPIAVQDRIKGSIIVVALEQCMLFTIWGIKVAVLDFIWQLSDGLIVTRRFTIAISSYVVISFVCIEVCYFAILCKPASQYWTVPVRDLECATYSTYSKILMALNISSDLMITCLPTAIIVHSRLPRKRRIVLVGVLVLALFTVIAAILNKYYRLASQETTHFAIWYVYEASVAFWVGQVVHCWPILQKIFGLRSFDDRREFIPRLREITEHRLEDQTSASSWWCRYVTHIPPSANDNLTQKDISRNRQASADLNAADVRRHTGLSFNLTFGSDDAGPAIAYRAANHID